MKSLTETGSCRTFAIVVGPQNQASTIFVPLGKSIDERAIELTLEKTPTGVPISRFRVSLHDCLKLIEQTYDGLIKAGWKAEEARQILPRGGCDGGISRFRL